MFLLTIHEAGQSLGAFEISDDVCRIGSRQAEGVQIDGLEPHALTIRRSGGDYHLFNRTDRPLTLHRRTLNPGESRVWKPGHVLKINPVELELSLPSGRHSGSTGVSDQTPDSPDVSSSNGFENRHIILSLCIVFVALVLFETGPNQAEIDQRFSLIVNRLHSAPHDSRLGLVKVNLQTAYDYEARGAPKEAAEYYTRIRRILLSKRSQHDSLRFEQSVRALEAQTLQFVGRRLASL